MKKIVAILAVVVVSAGAFAQTMDHSSHGSMGNYGHRNSSAHQNHGGMMNGGKNCGMMGKADSKGMKNKKGMMMNRSMSA